MLKLLFNTDVRMSQINQNTLGLFGTLALRNSYLLLKRWQFVWNKIISKCPANFSIQGSLIGFKFKFIWFQGVAGCIFADYLINNTHYGVIVLQLVSVRVKDSSMNALQIGQCWKCETQLSHTQACLQGSSTLFTAAF